MKLYTMFALCAMFLLFSTNVFSQRNIGNTRSDQSTTSRPGTSSRGDRGSPPANPTPAPVHHSPAPTVMRPPVEPPPPAPSPSGGVPIEGGCDCPLPDRPMIYGVSAVYVPPPSVPKNLDIELFDSWRTPEFAGYDFSDAEVVPYDAEASDMYFTTDGDISTMSVGDDTDIQDLGDIRSLERSRKIPPDGWSPDRVVRIVAGHAYAVWQWDGKCSRVDVSEVTPESVVFSWVSMNSIPRKAHGPVFER